MTLNVIWKAQANPIIKTCWKLAYRRVIYETYILWKLPYGVQSKRRTLKAQYKRKAIIANDIKRHMKSQLTRLLKPVEN